MNFMNFNDAEQQKSFDLIPDGVIVPVAMKITPGGAGEGGWLTPSKSSDAMMLNVELTVVEGPYAKAKIFTYMTVSGGTLNDKGESKGGNITRSTLRAILESARNINPNDMSDAAIRARQVSGFSDFQGMVFLMKVGVEKDKTGQYDPKNKIKAIITPDMPKYAEGYTKERVSETPAAGAPAFGGGGVAAPAQGPAFAPSAAAATPPPAAGSTAAPTAATPPPAAPSNPTPAWAK